jgi:hypothetical protein
LGMATFRWISEHFDPSDTVDVYNELLLACRRNLEFEQAMQVCQPRSLSPSQPC